MIGWSTVIVCLFHQAHR